MLKISSSNIPSEDIYDCFEGIIVTIANYLNRDFEMMFCTNMHLKFSKNVSISKYEVYNQNLKVFFKALKKYHGIAFYKKKSFSVAKFSKYIDKELKKKFQPIIITTDVYYLPWNRLYQKAHIYHRVLLTDYNKDFYYFIDPYFSKEILKLDRNDVDFYNHLVKIETIKCSSPYFNLLSNVNFALNCLYQSRETEKSFYKIDYNKFFDISTFDYDNFNLYSVPIIRKINTIINRRKCYIKLLQWFELKYFYDFSSCKEDLLSLISSWDNLKSVLLKAILKHAVTVQKEKLTLLLKSTLEKEKSTVNTLILNMRNYRNEIKKHY